MDRDAACEHPLQALGVDWRGQELVHAPRGVGGRSRAARRGRLRRPPRRRAAQELLAAGRTRRRAGEVAGALQAVQECAVRRLIRVRARAAAGGAARALARRGPRAANGRRRRRRRRAPRGPRRLAALRMRGRSTAPPRLAAAAGFPAGPWRPAHEP